MYWKHLQRFGLFTIPSFSLILSAGIFSNSHAQTVTTNAYDNASNYPSNTWTNGANGGTGFQPWTLSSSPGTGSAGSFIGDPSSGGMSGLSSSSFGLYANPTGSQASSSAERGFSSSLAIGQTLSFKWAINFDSGGGTNASKGVVLSAGSSEIFNIYNGGSQNISLNGTDVSTGYGTSAMTWSLTRTATNSYRVVVNRRDGSGNFSNNITVANGAIDKIKFYAYNMQAGDQAQPYFNELIIFTTDADSIAPVIALAQGVEQVAWVANGSPFSLSISDVIASDNSGTADVTFDPPTVNTAVDGLTKVTYTATDPSGNTATVVRVIAVGDASPGWRKLHSPRSATASAISSPKVYGRIYIDGATPGPGQASNITAELGVNTVDSNPSGWTGTGVWRAATYNAGFTGGDDEFESTINGAELTAGTYYYAYRFKIGSGAWQYAGINAAGTDGGPWNGTTSLNGTLSVVPVRNVTFAVDMNVQKSKGTFNPTSGQAVELKGSFNDWGAGIAMGDLDGDGIYTVTLPIQGNSGGSINYKFRITGAATDGSEWETVPTSLGNRSLTFGGAAETVKPVTFSNDGTTFAVWSGGAVLDAENLAKYAIGGGSDPNAQGEAPTVGKRFIVPNHYTYIEAIVRTDDNKLSFLAESSTDLSSGFSSTGTWTVEGAGQSVSQLNVPTGCERKRFIYWHGMAQEKMFLRLIATLAP